MRRYKEAYIAETVAFVDSLVNDEPVPCTGEDGLIALVMAIAAGISAEERRWVKFSELSKELCSLNSEIPLAQEECVLEFEESEKRGFVDLKKLASVLTKPFK